MILTRCRIVTPHHDKTGCKAGHTFPHRFRSRQLVTTVHGEPDRSADSRSAAALGAVELPHGVLWWHDRQHSVYQHDVYHGQDFVLQRQRSGGPGLVLSHRLSSVQIVDRVERERVQLEMYNKGQDNVGAQLALSDTFTFDLTDYALVEEAAADAEAHTDAPLHFPPTTCTGIVLSVQSGQATHQVCNTPYTCKDRQSFAFGQEVSSAMCRQMIRFSHHTHDERKRYASPDALHSCITDYAVLGVAATTLKTCVGQIYL